MTKPRPSATVNCVSNLFFKTMHFLYAGDREPGHCHVFDHVTFLARGSLRVTVNGVPTDFVAPTPIFIAKGLLHELVATEDDTLALCIHALRDGERYEDIVDPATIPHGARDQLTSGVALPLTQPVSSESVR
jgi:hypothetical protein